MISSVQLLQVWGCAALLATPSIALSQVQQTGVSSPAVRASVDLPPKPPQKLSLSPKLRGDLYMARKMYRDAIDMYREAPETAEIFNKIGIAFQEMSQVDQAKKNYEQALRLNQTYAEALNNLGTIYYEQHRLNKAVSYYKRALKYCGPSASEYANLGGAYFARRDFKKSSLYYEEAMKLDPDILEQRNTFGSVLLERTTNDLALFHLYLARAYARSGSNERALIYLRKALEEGLKDRKKLPEIPEFSSLKKDPRFLQLLAENPRPL